MEVKQDGKEVQRSKTSSAPAYRTCNRAALVASFFLMLIFGVFMGLSAGVCRVGSELAPCALNDPSFSPQPTWCRNNLMSWRRCS